MRVVDWDILYILRAMLLYFGLFALCYAAFRGDRARTNRSVVVAMVMAFVAMCLFLFDLYQNLVGQ